VSRRSRQGRAALGAIAASLDGVGANLTLEAPGAAPLPVGRHPERARVIFRSEAALGPLARRDHLALAEAYLAGEIQVEGDFLEVVKVTEVIAPDPTWRARLAFALQLLLRNRRRWSRKSIAFHYDRPPEFFFPWFERWRSYSHGIYASPDEAPADAQARKLQLAIDALGLKPGDVVFDMGCGWGSFIEFAGLRGVRVHGITISDQQHEYVENLIRQHHLPCSVQQIDFRDYRPRQRFAGAVFMGTFEHFSDYPRAARFLAEHLVPEARIYADFCTTRGVHQVGAFLAKYIWPGTATYVDVPRLLGALGHAGFNLHTLEDDTLSYAFTVRDWADAFDRAAPELAAAYGDASVRAFRIYLRASQYFLSRNRTQAYHLVAGRAPLGLDRAATASTTAARHTNAKRSPTRP
jgi:cyclopropane-fatty-acyl-phospholipid synthase